jgi:hypothetical protein
MVSNREGEIQTLPGASAGRSSMRDTGYRALGRRAPVIQQATAQYEYGDVENQVKAVEQYATVSARFPLDRRTARRSDHFTQPFTMVNQSINQSIGVCRMR